MPSLPAPFTALLRPDAYPHPVSAVSCIETHISWVFLTGELAYKIKRPVRYPFVDLRSRRRRTFLCREELRLNRRFAPEIYLGVSAITEKGGVTRVDGKGRVIEYAVKMRQFPASQELRRLLTDVADELSSAVGLEDDSSGHLELTELRAFGERLATIHAELPRASSRGRWGHPGGIGTILLANLRECAVAAQRLGVRTDFEALASLLRSRVADAYPRLKDRLEAGHVRECHGDLHAGNIVRYEGKLVAFDCVEFARRFRWIDVADEVAFLVADLEACQRLPQAHAFLCGYLDHSGDYDLLPLLNLYKAHRSLVRAKVTLLQTSEGQGRTAQLHRTAIERYHAYMSVTWQSLRPSPPLLILMCGLSGAGKTWLAVRIAPLLAAIVLRSDIERRRTQLHAPLVAGRMQADHYTPEARKEVYERLLNHARVALEGRVSVVVDATFQEAETRSRFRHLADQLGVQFLVVHCTATPGLQQARIRERTLRAHDASDADVQVLRQQSVAFEPLRGEENLSVIEVDTSRGTDVTDVIRRLRQASGSRGVRQPGAA